MGIITENKELTVQDKLDKLEAYCRKVESMFNEVKLWTNPEAISDRIKASEVSIVEALNKCGFLQKQIDRLTSQERADKKISDEEIKDLWVKSGIAQKQVASDFHISLATAGKYCNGHVPDLVLRHNLRDYFLDKINVGLKK